MILNSARSGWHDAFYMPWDSTMAHSLELAQLECSVQKTAKRINSNHAAHQALAGYIQQAIDTLRSDVRDFGHWMYNPLANNDHRESAEALVFAGAMSRTARMTAKKAERAEYVARGVLYRYRRMHQGGQSSAPDPLSSPEGFRAALLDVYGVHLVSENWAREWQPFVQICFDVCNDIDRMALGPVAVVVNQMKDEAHAA